MRRSLVGMAVLSLAALAPSWALADKQEDQRIARQVERELIALKDSGQLRGFNIDLQVDNGSVWMKGLVSSKEQLALALEKVRHLEGVTQVVNDLDVSPSETPAALAQPTVAEPEKQPKKRTPGLLQGLDLLTEPLFGKKAKSNGQDRQVQPAASEESAPFSQDEQIARELVKELKDRQADGSLRKFNIDLRVENADVLLSGYVQNKQQLSDVIEFARRIRGVRQVVNGLVVSAPAAYRNRARAVSNETQSAPTVARHPHLAYNPAYYHPQGRPVALTSNQLHQATPMPMGHGGGAMVTPARFDHPQLPGYAWPSYAAAPNYAQLTYPKQYSPAAWPYIGPFYPYPQVPLGWRKVSLEWDDGWWFLDFKSK